MTGIRDYSPIAASNLSVGGISIAEGMARASVNNALRSGYADLANLLLDTGGGVTTTGSANAYLLNLPSAPSAYADNLLFVCKFHAAVTGPATININGLGIKDIKKLQEGIPAALVQGDVPAGHRAVCVYSSADNAVLMLLSAPTFTASGSGAVSRPITSRLADSVHLLDYVPPAEHAAILAGTSTYDASTALQNAIASVTTDVRTTAVAGPEVILPYGLVHFDSTIQLDKTVMLKGHGSGQAGGFATILEFAADTHGIIVHALGTWDVDKGGPAWDSGHTYIAGDHVYTMPAGQANIYECITPGGGAASNSPSHTSGDVTYADGYTWRLTVLGNTSGAASVLRDFQIKSLGGTTGHGIWPRQRCRVENVQIDNFPENGVHIYAGVALQGILQGNANNCYFSTMRITNCNNGFYVRGSDANACHMEHIDCSSNWGMGFNDQSFLGNTYIGCHTSGNGVGGQVSYGGNRYYLIDETLGSTTVPGTNGAVWVLVGAGGVHPSYPLWVSGHPYVLGHSFRTTSENSLCGVVFGLYTEAGQPPAHWGGAWIVITGASAFTPSSNAFVLKSALNDHVMSRFHVNSYAGSDVDFGTYISRTADEAITWIADGDSTSGLAMVMDSASDGCWDIQHARVRTAVKFTTNLNTLTGGRAAALISGNVLFPRGLWLGKSETVARQITNDTAVPTTGQWAAGDVVLNSAPLLGEPWGWRCILTGDFAATPPVFQPLRDTGSQQTLTATAGGGVAFILTPGTSPYRTLFTGTMTADKSVTLSTTGALIGLCYRITRTATGAFNLNVGGLRALAFNTWGEFTYDGAAYYLSAYGAL